MVKRARLDWLLHVQSLAFSEFKMAVSAILNFGQFSTFELDDIESLVVPLFKGFPGWGVHFWSYMLDTGVKVKVKS